jgi:4-hydroxybenzoate polyprenyltransferase
VPGVDDWLGPLLRRLRALAVVHPFPSLLNAALVFGLALVAGGAPRVAGGLALAMHGLQFAIGAFNDYFDVDIDVLAKPAKPIPAGLISRPGAALIGTLAGGGGLLVAAVYGAPELLLALAMLACGLAYDLILKRGPLGWVCFAVALPLLPVYAWFGAAGVMPPRAELLLPLAALAGPALQLANGLVDLERDSAVGVRGLPGRLGRTGSLAVMAVLQSLVHAIAWLTLLLGAAALPGILLVVVAAGAMTLVGLVLSTSGQPARREWGWRAQALGLALLAVAWLTAVSG